ncbi:MAG: ATP-dependent DNA helicase RecQ [Spirochaetaceae bacterium]|nr:MAG: ATP-dependent DNA helicase RecQ [Spirochaetaceae bacterium]
MVSTMEIASQDPILEEAERSFGLSYLFPYQRLVISNVLEAMANPEALGRRQLVILPTGAGKSLCFQLPAVMIKEMTVVIFPLLSLMADQERRMQEGGIRCRVLRGGQSAEERTEIWKEADAGALRILLTNPETASGPEVLKRLSALPIGHIVIDESHCVAEWGETFRPSYLKLKEVVAALPAAVVTAFTATASPPILAKITEHVFGSAAAHLIVGNPDRSNLRYSVLPTLSKDATLISLLSPHPPGAPADLCPPSASGELRPPSAPADLCPPGLQRPALIFCATRKRAENTAMLLRERLGEDEIRYYHAGLSREEKKRIEDWFFQSPNGILASTTAYGMGVDKANIRSVLHRDVSPSIESYLQESGRAGRDREPAEAVLLFSPSDTAPRGAPNSANSPTTANAEPPDYTEQRRLAMLAYAAGSDCRREHLLRLLGHELEFCNGCDVCRGTAVHEAPELPVLLRFVARNARALTLDEAVATASGERSHFVFSRGLHLRRDYGCLSTMHPDEVRDCFTVLENGGLLARPGRSLFPRRLRLTAAGRARLRLSPAGRARLRLTHISQRQSRTRRTGEPAA